MLTRQDNALKRLGPLADRLGPKWESSELSVTEQGEYVARVPAPAKGWAAFFVELTFASGFEAPFKFTTAIRVVPETLPFADKPLGNNLEPESEH